MENNELQNFINCFGDDLKKNRNLILVEIFLSLIKLQQSTFKEITKELKKKKEEMNNNDNIDNN